MEENIEHKRIETYRTADPAIKALYGNLELGGVIAKFSEKNSLTNEKRLLLIDSVGDVILNINSAHKLMEMLTRDVGFSWKVAGEFMSEIGHFLDAIPDSTETSTSTPAPAAPIIPPIRPVTPPPPTPPVLPTAAPTEPAKPLTRDELMHALERKQSTGNTLEAMRQKLEQATQQRTVGYDAVEQNSEQNPGA